MMMNDTDWKAIQERIKNGEDAAQTKQDALALINEVSQMRQFLATYNNKVTHQLNELEADMGHLESENNRLRRLRDSAYFERDASVSLLAHLAQKLGYTVGTGEFPSAGASSSSSLEKRVVVDLPAGQVSWDFAESEAHLFEDLPKYAGEFENNPAEENYIRVMNPGL